MVEEKLERTATKMKRPQIPKANLDANAAFKKTKNQQNVQNQKLHKL